MGVPKGREMGIQSVVHVIVFGEECIEVQKVCVFGEREIEES